MYRQRTISKPVQLIGTNVFLKFPGMRQKSKIKFFPAPVNEGITFFYKGKPIPATLKNAYTPCRLRSSFSSCVGLKKGLTSIIKVEHILAHLYAMGIDNLRIYLQDRVVPRFDEGGKEIFANLEHLVEEQDTDRELWRIKTFFPLSHIKRDTMPDRIDFLKGSEGETNISYVAGFPHKSVGDQVIQIDYTDVEEYKKEIMGARGIFFMPFTRFVGDDAVERFREYLFKKGVHGITPENSLLIGRRNTESYLNENGMGRTEFVRHKIQDGLAQLALSGKRFVQGSVRYHKTSHQFDMNAWRAAEQYGLFERVN